MKKVFVFLFILIEIQSISAQVQSKYWKTEVFDSDIHSLQVFRPNWELNYPVLELNSNQILVVNFDDLHETLRDFSYTIEFCNADWSLSDLVKSDYLDGFDNQPLTDYRFSSNTTQQYVHYQLNLPNSDIDFLLAGNYILKVYKDNNNDSLIFSQRIYVLQNKLIPEVKILRPVNSEENSSHQQVNVRITDAGGWVRNPYDDLIVKMNQNNRPDREKVFKSPKYVRGNVYEYNDERLNTFAGSSEFLHFDTKSIRFKEMRTDSIVYDGTFYHYYIQKDVLMPWRTYVSNPDINGKYKVQLQNSEESAILADYVFVHLNLQADKSTFGQTFYALGDFNIWKKDEVSKMKWNKNANAFSCTFFLKQGYYDYIFENEDFKKNFFSIENHTETENDYLIWVYLKDKTLNYDRLVGFLSLNSRLSEN